jgi:hypothetical protein
MPATASANEPAVVVSYPLDQVLENPCTGETVLFTGQFFLVGHVVVDEESGLHVVNTAEFRIRDATAVSLLTGVRYIALNQQGYVYSVASPSDPSSSDRYIFNYHLTILMDRLSPDEGANDDFLGHHNGHLTVTPSGETTVDFSKTRAECR